ncbi:MAG: DNA-directed RNA polymerase subunit omega [Candidatus Hydrogenedentes bacterium]|nr:DNA-directed RNA polymerase subunit omega [Candidatus Hydrogenedentota bacterium]
MRHLALEDFELDGEKMDSLYRLVNIAARRAVQLNKPEARSLMAPVSKKPVTLALEEILDGKVWYRIGGEDEDEYDVG